MREEDVCTLSLVLIIKKKKKIENGVGIVFVLCQFFDYVKCVFVLNINIKT